MITMVLKILDSKIHYINITCCNKIEQLDVAVFEKTLIGVNFYIAYTFIFIIFIKEREDQH